MQPNSNETWQAPEEQPSQAPYGVPLIDTPVSPIVTMSPDPALPSADEGVSEPAQPAIDENDQPVQWQAMEYISHERNAPWFVAFAVVTLGLMALAIFLIQSWTFAILIPVMAVALLTYTQRAPRTLNYSLGRKGLHINDHLYPFSDFKAFGVIHDGADYSIMLVPVKRFRPGVSVYFPEAVGERLVDMLAARFPMRELQLDIVDRLIRKLRI